LSILILGNAIAVVANFLLLKVKNGVVRKKRKKERLPCELLSKAGISVHLLHPYNAYIYYYFINI